MKGMSSSSTFLLLDLNDLDLGVLIDFDVLNLELLFNFLLIVHNLNDRRLLWRRRRGGGGITFTGMTSSSRRSTSKSRARMMFTS